MKTIPLCQPGTRHRRTPSDSSPDSTSAGGARVVADPARTEALKPAIVEAISTVYDPEIPVNIWELGLIYDIVVDAAGVAGDHDDADGAGLSGGAVAARRSRRAASRAWPACRDAKVEVVWEPAWDKDRMSEAARLQLGLW